MQSELLDLNEVSSVPCNFPGFFLDIVPSQNHAVLFVLNRNDPDQKSPPPPASGDGKWDTDHVRMPFAKESLHEVGQQKLLGITLSSTTVTRWQIIEAALKKPITNSYELAKAILSYNTKYEKVWKFQELHRFLNDYLSPAEAAIFFNDTLPKMALLALDLPNLIQAPIPLLKQRQNKSVSLTQQQIASLLANAFFCTFPWRNTTTSTEYAKYAKINFSSLYESNDVKGVMEKLKCICHYFIRVCNEPPSGVVTFTRRCVPEKDFPNWESSTVLIECLPVYVTSNFKIEDTQGLIQVDFANELIGKGVLGRGLLQEEIRFLISPELMVTALFTEAMEYNEAVMILGTERYSNYTGYGRESFRWAGDYRDNTPLDNNRRRRSAVLAIDAIQHKNPNDQYQKHKITRDIKKAWTGFSFFTEPKGTHLNYPGVATGNWGCGAFHGSPQLKALIQIIAAAQARRPLAYCTYRDAELTDSLIEVYNVLRHHKITVGQLYIHVIKNVNKQDFFQALRDLQPPARIGNKLILSSSPGNDVEDYSEELLQQSENLHHLEEDSHYLDESLRHSEENLRQSQENLRQSQENLRKSEENLRKSEENLSHSGELTNHSENFMHHSEKLPRHSEKLPSNATAFYLPRQSEELPRQSEELPRQSEELPRQSEELPRQSEKLSSHSEELPRSSEEQPHHSEEHPRGSIQVPHQSKKPDDYFRQLSAKVASELLARQTSQKLQVSSEESQPANSGQKSVSFEGDKSENNDTRKHETRDEIKNNDKSQPKIVAFNDKPSLPPKKPNLTLKNNDMK